MTEKECRTCKQIRPIYVFPAKVLASGKKYYRPDCQTCKYRKEKAKRTPEQHERRKQIYREYAKNNPEKARHGALKTSDKKKGFTDCLSLEEYRLYTEQNCYYCDYDKTISVDRIDNNLGHSLHNVVACCEICNNILSDLPMEAKICMREGLYKARKEKHFDNWIIPTKR